MLCEDFGIKQNDSSFPNLTWILFWKKTFQSQDLGEINNFLLFVDLHLLFTEKRFQ